MFLTKRIRHVIENKGSSLFQHAELCSKTGKAGLKNRILRAKVGLVAGAEISALLDLPWTVEAAQAVLT